MSENIYQKIVKLLRTAERAEGNEAEIALMKAQKLATEHQVDLATIDTAEGETSKKEDFDTAEFVPDNKALSRFILWILTHHFRVKSVIWTYSGKIQLLGRKSDVVFATYLFSWLMDHFRSEWRAELRRPNTSGHRRNANAFFYGMYRGLDDKLEEANRETVEAKIQSVAETRTTTTAFPDVAQEASQIKAQYQLAIVQEKDELEAEYYRRNPKLGHARSIRVNHNNIAMAAGRKAGARTRIPGMPLNHSSRSAIQ